ncbi:MAG TPA: 50S ribosomal protein L11 methyltransferase [Dehalococcoidia bacterium]|nr:50S ribosomal protein L11 methyltransferase [Dehalococcoidia bacterium]
MTPMSEPETTGAWLEIAVEVAGIDSETAADLLRQACSGGVAIEPGHRLDRAIDAYVVDGDAPALVRGYIPASDDYARIRSSLQLALKMAPLRSPPKWRRVRKLREASWRDAWKKHFGVQRIGRALVVRPSWVDYRLKGGETVIQIDPGLAFGTGQHPTTGMCLRLLEELAHPDASVLDLGSGSGILGIAAAKLGAARVLALDTDPQAVKATGDNVAVNSVATVVEPREGPLESAGSEAFDIIVANISGLTLERLAGGLAASLKAGGALIASGFLEDAVSGLRQAFESAGLRIERVADEGVWRAILARRIP